MICGPISILISREAFACLLTDWTSVHRLTKAVRTWDSVLILYPKLSGAFQSYPELQRQPFTLSGRRLRRVPLASYLCLSSQASSISAPLLTTPNHIRQHWLIFNYFLICFSYCFQRERTSIGNALELFQFKAAPTKSVATLAKSLHRLFTRKTCQFARARFSMRKV